MKLLFTSSLFLLFIFACSPQQEAVSEKASDLVIYNSFAQLAPLLQKQNDSTYIINFWATWCKPCVKELPYFEELHNTYQGKKVKVLLVSLDFPDQIEKKLIPFIQEKQLKSDVIALTDSDMNSWIPKISEEWSGAIPATLVYRNSKRAFHEKSFETFDELNNIIKPFTIIQK